MNVRDSTFFLFSLDCRSSSWYWFVVECWSVSSAVHASVLSHSHVPTRGVFCSLVITFWLIRSGAIPLVLTGFLRPDAWCRGLESLLEVTKSGMAKCFSGYGGNVLRMVKL
jgi:hypothetical protein